MTIHEDFESCIDDLHDDVRNLTNENEFLHSLLDSFWSGDVPNNATLNHMILAKAGRLRLAEKAKICSLLGGNS
jgi:hypothetical protein